MKVLLTATVQSHICQFHRPLVDILHQHGCEVHVAARDNLAEKNGLRLDFVDRVYNLPFARSPRSFDNFRVYFQLKKILATEHYDIVHCNTPMGGIVTRLAARSSRKKGTDVFYTAHGFHFYKGAPFKNWLCFYPVERFFARYTDKLITITTEDRQLAEHRFPCTVEYLHGIGVDEQRYFSVSDDEKRRLRRSMGFSEEQKIILCVGELLLNKNQAMVIRAMPNLVRHYPNARLLLAGNGPQKSNLEHLIADLGMTKNILLLGYRTDLQNFQRIADISVSCSRREGLPLNIVEAMFSRTPVVATENRGHRELIQSGENGFLVKQNDTEAMLERILYLLDNATERSRIISNAEKFARQYGFANVKNELNKIYFPSQAAK